MKPSLTRDRYIRAAVLGGYPELVRKVGGDYAAMMARAGIDVAALVDPEMLISWRSFGDLLERSSLELERSSLGLDWAEAVPAPFSNYGPMGLLAKFSATLGEWCTVSRDYCRYHTNGFEVELLSSDDGADIILRFASDEIVPPSRHQMEHTLANVCGMVRSLAVFGDEAFRRVRFRHFEPEDVTAHEQLFRCPLEFGCPHYELVYAREMHDLPIEHESPILTGLFERYFHSRTGRSFAAESSILAAVGVAIPSLIGTQYCSLVHVAELLAMSPKALQRRLAKENTNFAAMLDQVRERVAAQLLSGTDAPIASIAGLLGYASAPPFTHAFKRWTGDSPRDYRKRHRAIGSGN